MKYLSGYITAAVFGALSWVLMEFGERFTVVVDMVYPYVIRTLQSFLADWTGTVDFCLWQVLAAVLFVLLLTSVVLMIVMKWNPIRWFGWVLACGSVIFLLHTAVFGLNYYAGDLSDDLRMEVSRYTMDELTEATAYYRDKANTLADKVKRDNQGNVEFKDFDTLAKQAGEGFHTLTYDKLYPIFAGSSAPVKKLGWPELYTSMGIRGITMGLTGEAAVNPQIPDLLMPVTMCHEMAHRMCIATEKDAAFASFLAASVNQSEEFQYSAYFTAFRYCLTALESLKNTQSATAASEIRKGMNANLQKDLLAVEGFEKTSKDPMASGLYRSANKLYLKISGDPAGINPGNDVCNLLVNWHIQQVVLPSIAVTEKRFDPYDETQVDLTGIINAG